MTESREETVGGESKSNSPLRQVFHGSAWYGLAIGVNRLIPGLLTVVLTWWLEPRELGTVSFVLALYGVLSLVADWSIAYALQKVIPEHAEHVGEVAWTALFVRLCFSALLGAVCWGVDTEWGAFHGYGACLALLLVASSLGTIVYVHNARCEFAKGSLFSIAIYLAWLPLALLLVRLGMHVRGPIFALSVSFFAIGIPGFTLSPSLRGRIAFLPLIAMEILRFGAWATLATLLSGLADQMGILLIAYTIGDVQAGVFKVATTFGVVPALLGMTVVLPLMPLAKHGLLKGNDISVNLIRPILRYLFMLGLPVVAAGFVLAPAVIRTFVRESYLGAVWPMRILLGASFARMFVTVLSGVLFVGQGLKDLAKIHGTVAVIGLAGGLLLVQRRGIAGVAVALLVAWVVGLILLYRWFERRHPVPLEWGKYLRYAVFSACMAALVLFAVRQIERPIGQFFVGGCVAFFAFALQMGIQREFSFHRININDGSRHGVAQPPKTEGM